MFSLVNLDVARSAKRDLLPIDSRRHLVKLAQFHVNGFDMSNMMHLHIVDSSTVST